MKGYKGYYQNGKGKPGFGKGFQFGGLGQGSQDKGKGKGKWTSDGGKKGKEGGFMKGVSTAVVWAIEQPNAESHSV